ncbi:MAG: hypothetical protein Q9207_007978, partial [Kuettlingeria erythrocarpa]
RILSALLRARSHSHNHDQHDQQHQHPRLGPTGPVHIFCDVRDAALAHVRALEVDEEAVRGKRFFVVAADFSNEGIERVVLVGQGAEQEAADDDGSSGLDDSRKEEEEEEEEAGKKKKRHDYGFDNSRSRHVLGMRYRGLRECVEDTVKAMVPMMEVP